MAYIYKITNLINQKSYIGKTNFSIEKRWKEHCKDMNKRHEEQRPLYSAMRKYGIENFLIEELEEISELQSEEREKFWIEYYGTFKNGYNATIGGDGKQYIDYDLVVATYLELKNKEEVARTLEICVRSVDKILNLKKINKINSEDVNKMYYSKIVNMYSLKGEYIQSFSSFKDAARWIIKNGISNAKITSIATNIGRVVSGKRKTCCGFIWK